ncbi:MAG: NAD(P)/FAD-dependent oxidoreductase [Candidatus Omnitrophica bacterium]|nr:NAD(P)/FAD-dependent oxidoreductase [Candidatus Omnitrophota bacterium]
MEIYDAVIIGAGPSGIICAGRAAERGRKVLLLEKKSSLAKKLLISGKGRCNLTNAGNIDKFLTEFSPSGIFLRNVFNRFFNKELCNLFEKLGVVLKTERGGRIFPRSDKAGDILGALEKYLKINHVSVKTGEEVENIVTSGASIEVLTSRAKYYAKKMVIATGGLSYPETGCTGFGFKLAEKLGHKIIEPRPGLVGLVVKEDAAKKLQGLSLENVEVTLLAQGKIYEKIFGDMLFTHYGISGPIVLDLSNKVCDLIKEGKETCVSINLKPALNFQKLDSRLLREFSASPNKTVKNIFVTLLPQRLIIEFLKRSGVDANLKANQVSKETRRELVKNLFDFRFHISKVRPIEEAIVTRGGVNTKEINPKTMESRLVKNLYFCGEVIDVDAKTGGYNMQAAFSTGYVCGENL